MFLVTTALEETFPTSNEPTLFLGEWCLRYSRRKYWQPIDKIVLPYHWDDRKKLFSDFQYLMKLHEQLLIELTDQLNTIHQTKHEVRYWRILVGPWLGYFTQMVFDRWTSIQEATQSFKLTNTIILNGNEINMIPRDMESFEVLFEQDEWNHYIYSYIIKNFTDVPSTSLKINSPTKKSFIDSKFSFKQSLKNFMGIALNKFIKKNDAFLISTYLPLKQELKFYFKLKQFPQFWKKEEIPNEKVNFQQREWQLNGEEFTQFEECIRALIPMQIPTTYLEGYKHLISKISKLNWPENPKFIWTSNSYSSDDVFKAWAASKTELGNPLIIGQHGGHYGIGKWSFTENHQVSISDYFLTWGWGNKDIPKIIPLGQLKAKLPIRESHADRPKALLVSFAIPRQSYHLYSITISTQWLDHLKDQYKFVESLPENIREVLTVRLSRQDYGWDQAERWRDTFPDLTLDTGQSQMNELINDSRIFIATYNATTYLESFTMNIPTVIFWNPNHWEIRESAREYFELLKRVGIFHDTPESAANHVAKIWNDVDGWWKSAEVTNTVEKFKKNYSYSPKNLISRLDFESKKIIKNKKINFPNLGS